MPKTCLEISKLLQDYIDGTLDKSTAQSVKEHIEKCPECALEYKYLKTLIGDISKTKLAAPPASFQKELHERILKETSVKKVVPFNYRFFTRIAATAAVVAIAVFCAWHGKSPIENAVDDLTPKTAQSSEPAVQKIPEEKQPEQKENANQAKPENNNAVVLPAENAHIHQQPVVDSPEPQPEIQKETKPEEKNEETLPPAAEAPSPDTKKQDVIPESTDASETDAESLDYMPMMMSAAPDTNDALPSDEYPESRAAGGGSSSANFKSAAYFCRYTADLNENNELLNILIEKYGAAEEGGKYIIRADSAALGDISSLLADYGIYLEYEGSEETENIIELN